MAELLLGPLLRYVGTAEATVWVEVDGPCAVRVLDHEATSFQVGTHHYALVVIRGLEPGSCTEYEVHLDGARAWPLEEPPFGPSYVRTLREGGDVRLAFGSCRVSVPDIPPWVRTKDEDPRGREVDALAGLVTEMQRQEPAAWPDLLLLVGDQVYADEVSPGVQGQITARLEAGDRHSSAPPNEVGDFEEYTWLYRESWADASLRWLLSTVSSAMIFDDHDVHDDWNTSEAWVREIRERPWWRERILGAYASYWLYQHLGNMSPEELAEDELFAELQTGGDHTRTLQHFAGHAADEVAGTRWSFRRDLGATRLVVLDSRAGRILDEGDRKMLSDDELDWVEAQLREPGATHLLVATSLPWLLAPGLHHLEAWNEAVCGGAWGPRLARRAEKLRQDVDLEHWAAFRQSFERLTRLLADVGSGPAAPATIAVLSGDVHHAYVAEASFPGRQVSSRIIQAVCSPIRNPLDKKERRALRAAASRPAAAVARVMARAAGVARPEVRWRFTQDPLFDNQICLVELEGRSVSLSLKRTLPADWEHPRLHNSLEWSSAA